MPQRSRAFTLLELVATLAIVGLLITIALPALGDAVTRSRLRTAVTELLETLDRARLVATLRGHETEVCPGWNGRECSPGGAWSSGWVAWDHSSMSLFGVAGPHDRKIVSASSQHRGGVLFRPDGTSPGKNQRITLCMRGKPATALTVVVPNVGRAHRDASQPAEADACARAVSQVR